jgi:Zn-dependent peptidase ImmA (M78 family)
MGLDEIDAVDPVAICAHYDIPLFELSEIEPDSPFLDPRNNSAFSAVTVPCGLQTAIVHNDTHHIHRQRSNICHELAHCFLGHKSTPPLTTDGFRSRDGAAEEEAHFLCGALLLPNEAARYLVSSGLLPQAQRLYGISKPMLTYRLRVSGAHVIHERRMMATRSKAI